MKKTEIVEGARYRDRDGRVWRLLEIDHSESNGYVSVQATAEPPHKPGCRSSKLATFENLAR